MQARTAAAEFEADTPRLLEGVRVLRLGHHDPAYSRNRILAKALERAGATVVDLSDRRQLGRRLPGLLRRGSRVAFDLVLVAYPAHADTIAARLLAKRRGVPVVLDAFVSLYEAAVEDQGAASPGSLAARRYRFEDRMACRLADLVLLDTDAHISYFRDEFGLKSTKFARVWVGADDDLLPPRAVTKEVDVFVVVFYGSFNPLHGVDDVIRAAALIERAHEEVAFVLVGEGRTRQAAQRLAAALGVTSVRFLARMPYADLLGLMAGADVCLGVFGTTTKARRVIPNKVFDALALAKPVVTADTPAIREALVPGEHCLSCPAGDPAGLAESILELKGDRLLRERLAANGYELHKTCFSIDAIARQLAAPIRELLDG